MQVQQVDEDADLGPNRVRVDHLDGVGQRADGGEAHELEADPDAGRCGTFLELRRGDRRAAP